MKKKRAYFSWPIETDTVIATLGRRRLTCHLWEQGCLVGKEHRAVMVILLCGDSVIAGNRDDRYTEAELFSAGKAC